MNGQGFFKNRIFPILFMFVMTFVFISGTTVIYTVTKDAIKLNETLFVKKAVLKSAGIPIPEDPNDIDALYNERVKEVKDESGEIAYHTILDPETSAPQGYVLIRTGSGLWGDITAAIGLDTEGETLTGIEIIDQNETPGLGGKISEPWFKEQFRGKRGPLTTVAEGEETEESEFQAITGATYSSNGIKVLLNSTFQEAAEVIKTGPSGK